MSNIKKTSVTIKQLCNIINKISPTMDDYLYVCDFENDLFYISPRAVDRFAMENHTFNGILQGLKGFIYHDDFADLQKEIVDTLNGITNIHNMNYRWISKSGRPVWINGRGVAIKKDNKSQYLIGCINEIGKRQKAHNLSGLLGETSIKQYFDSISSAPKPDGFIMRIGIDDLKGLNARLGIEFGDTLIKKVAEIINNSVIPEQMVYHFSGDQFIIVDFKNDTSQDGENLYKRIRTSIDHFIEITNYEAVFTISAGLVMCSDIDDFSFSNIIRATEFALLAAKQKGRNQCYIFKKEEYIKYLRQRNISRKLRRAVNKNFRGFKAYFQPIFNSEKNCIMGAEALIRYESREYGMVNPAEFIPILEKTGLIIPVGKWIINKSLAACKRFQSIMPGFHINVNISSVQMMTTHISRDVISAIREFDIDPSSITIELTESISLSSDPRFLRVWNRLKDTGVKLAIDDFGSGYSNFRYLITLNPDIVKTDYVFTTIASEDKFEFKLLKLFSEMIHSLNMAICVEGAETKERFEMIKSLNPEYIQGYYIGKPYTFEELAELIKNQKTKTF